MFTSAKDFSHQAGIFAGFVGSVALFVTLFSLVTFFTSSTTPVHALLAGIVFAVGLIGGGMLLRWYLR